MSWRKLFVRSLVFGVVGLCACAVFVYCHWTSPAVVRQKVLAVLEDYLPGAGITLDSARLQILGGISLSELHLTRRDDPDRIDFLHVPAATIHYDKEKLSQGLLSLQKVEFDRPRLRLVRNRDGTWNLAGISRPVDPNEPRPTMVIHDGTIILDDRQDGVHRPPAELTHVNLTMLNDRVPSAAISGTARSELAGELEIRGIWNRRTQEVNLSLQVQGLPVTPALLQRLTLPCPTAKLDAVHLEGTANIKADLAYTPGTPLSYDVRCELTQGKLKHDQLPLREPLDHLNARVRFTNGLLQVDDLHARLGKAQVQIQGTAWFPCPATNFDGVLEVRHLALCEGLFEHPLPSEFKDLYNKFKPLGPATLRVECKHLDGHWGAGSRLSLIPENMSASFQSFPYLLEGLKGRLDMNLLTNKIDVNVVGKSGSRPVSIKGSWHGKGLNADAKIDIQATDIPLDEKLLGALDHTASGQLARSFHASGKGDITATVLHKPGIEKCICEYHVYFHDADIQWEPFPLLLTGMKGYLDILPDHYEFYDFQGRHNDGVMSVQGQSTPAGADKSKARLLINITGLDVALDSDLRKALQPHPSLINVWETFAPSGRIDFTARVDRPLAPAGPDPEAAILDDMTVNVTTRGSRIQPKFFPYAMHDLVTRVLYHKKKVHLEEIRARHDGTEIKLKSVSVDLRDKGGFYAELKDLEARDLRLDEPLLQALPPALRKSFAPLDLKAPVFLRTDLKVYMADDLGTAPDIGWDGQLELTKGTLHAGIELKDVSGVFGCRGRSWHDSSRGGALLALKGNFRLDQLTLLKQPFHDASGHFHVLESAPEVLAVDLKAPVFGGDVSGQVRLESSSSLLRYAVNVTASQIDLEEFGRHNLGPDSQLKGLAMGRLFLKGESSSADTLDGNGRIDVPRGQIRTLPFLLDLLKFLGLRWPDRTMFDEAKAAFQIHGRQVHIDHLDLLGNAISLYGDGDLKFQPDGIGVKLDFYPSWGRIEQIVGPALRSIPAEIGKGLLKIEARGQLTSNPSDLKFTKRPAPFLTEPFRYLGSKMNGSQ